MSQPSRHGAPWSDEEVQQLLQEVKQKINFTEIASKHQRTSGSIRGRLKQLAADYYYNDNRPIDEIMKFTGLDAETIADAISKRQFELNMKEKNKRSSISNSHQPQEKESMISLLKEIRDLMKQMVRLMNEPI